MPVRTGTPNIVFAPREISRHIDCGMAPATPQFCF